VLEASVVDAMRGCISRKVVVRRKGFKAGWVGIRVEVPEIPIVGVSDREGRGTWEIYSLALSFW
jgi:hypothetical protein